MPTKGGPWFNTRLSSLLKRRTTNQRGFFATCPSPCGDPHWGNGASAQLSGKTSENSLVARMRCRILLLTVVVLITLPHGVAAACSANWFGDDVQGCSPCPAGMTSESPSNTGTYACRCPDGFARVFDDLPQCVASSECSGGVLDRVTRKCWGYVDQARWFGGARQSCQVWGGDLATVANSRDFEVGRALFDGRLGTRAMELLSPGLWIGMEGGKWVDGASVVEDRAVWKNAYSRRVDAGAWTAGRYTYSVLFGGIGQNLNSNLVIFWPSNYDDCHEGATTPCAGLYYTQSHIPQRPALCSRVADADTGGAEVVLEWCGCLFMRSATGTLLRSGSCAGCGEALDLSNSALASLSGGVFAGLSFVRSLDLSNNRLHTASWSGSAAIFAEMTLLERLDVSGNGIEGMAAGFHTGFFLGLQTLKHLRVQFNTWRDFDFGWNGWNWCPENTFGDGLTCTHCPAGMFSEPPYNAADHACLCPAGSARVYGDPPASACVPSAECDGVLDPVAKKCWRALRGEYGFTGARAACEEWGGSLASVVNGRDEAIARDVHGGHVGQRVGQGMWVGMFLGEWLDGASRTGAEQLFRNSEELEAGAKQFALFHNYEQDPKHACHNSSSAPDGCAGLWWVEGLSSYVNGPPICSKAVNVSFAVAVHSSCGGCTFWRSPADELYRNGSCNATCSDLDLSNKVIASLDADVFVECGGIWRISLAENRLSEFKTAAFAHCSDLTHLDLAGNRFGSASLQRGMFRSLAALTHLSLANNAFSTLPANVFEGVSALQWLDLSACRLTKVVFGAFDHLANLEWLLLMFNRITRLEPGTLQQLPSLRHLRMFGSPVECTSLLPPSLESIDLPPRPICLPQRCLAHWANVSDMQPQDESVEVMTTIVAVETLLFAMRRDALPALDAAHRARGLYVQDLDALGYRCWCTFSRNCFPQLDVPCVGWCGQCPAGHGTFDNGTTCWPNLECEPPTQPAAASTAPACWCAPGFRRPTTQVGVRDGVPQEGGGVQFRYNLPESHWAYALVAVLPGYVLMPMGTETRWEVGQHEEHADFEVRFQLLLEEINQKHSSLGFWRLGHASSFFVHLDWSNRAFALTDGYQPAIPFGSNEGILSPMTWHDVTVRRQALEVTVSVDGVEVISGVMYPFQFAYVGFRTVNSAMHVSGLEGEFGELWDGRTCADDDECERATHGCPATNGRRCVNTPGSFECGCEAGLVPSVDGAECSAPECGVNVFCAAEAACEVGGGSFACVCNEGFADWSGGWGTRCEPDECGAQTHNCDAQHAACTDTEDSFLCSCAPGFHTPASAYHLLECASAQTSAPKCSVDVLLEPWMEQARISIAVQQTDFQSSTEFISSVVVGKDAAPVSLIDDLKTSGSDCRCGDYITIARDVLLPALAAGESVPMAIEATSQVNYCPCEGWYLRAVVNVSYEVPSSAEGVVCVNTDECAEGGHNCHAQAVCADSDGSFSCACNAGYAGDGVTCEDVDECAEGTAAECADPHAGCSNTAGGYECSCNAGYRDEGTCVNVDECSEGGHNCHTHAACADSEGGFACTCDVGYSGDGVMCEDVDECSAGGHGCDAHAECTNMDGSSSCVCNAGYAGDGVTCEDVDECAEGTAAECADPHAGCSNTAGGYECSCNAGYLASADSEAGGVSTLCEEFDFCAAASNPCHADAACADEPPPSVGGSCACRAGYAGDGFECAEIDFCSFGLCHPNALCSDAPPPSASGTCACKPGWAGSGFVCEEVVTIDENAADGCGEGHHLVTQCPEPGGVEVSEFGGHCYLALGGASDLKTAQQDCTAAHPNAYVAIPNSAAEAAHIWGLHSTPTWVGVRRLDPLLPITSLSSFQFLDSLAFVPSSFGTDPTWSLRVSLSGPAIESCVRMTSTRTWMDRFCTASFARVCELPLGQCAANADSSANIVGVSAGCAVAGLGSIGGVLYYYKWMQAQQAKAAASAEGEESARKPLHVRLVAIRDGRVEAEVEVKAEGSVLFGREADPPYCLDHDSCSRQHARLELTADEEGGHQLLVTDLGSPNGTRVDGTRLPPHEPTQVHNGQRVSFGALATVFLVAGLPHDIPRPSIDLVLRPSLELPRLPSSELGPRRRPSSELPAVPRRAPSERSADTRRAPSELSADICFARPHTPLGLEAPLSSQLPLTRVPSAVLAGAEEEAATVCGVERRVLQVPSPGPAASACHGHAGTAGRHRDSAEST